MKLKNKQTPNKLGKIVPYDAGKDGGIAVKTDQGIVWYYHSLAELNEEWEDATEEPKEYWYLENNGEVVKTTYEGNLYEEKMQQIGNYFLSRKEAKKAVERLRAWKRLKDKGFEFNPVDRYEALCGNGFNIPITATMPPEAYTDAEVSKDLDLLFGGEE